MRQPVEVPVKGRERIFVGLVLAVSLVAHLASFLYLSAVSDTNPGGPQYPVAPGDSSYYAHMADNLLRYGAYVSTTTTDVAVPDNANLPGYPLLLAGAKTLTGSFASLLVPQMLLVFVGMYLMYVIARRFMPWQIALVPALLYGLEPMVVFTNSTLLTDGLFTALLVMIVYVGFFAQKPAGLLRSALLGLALGLAAFLRPTGLLLMPIILAFYGLSLWLQGGEGRTRRVAASLAVALVVVGALIVPWMLRNRAQVGRFEFFHSGTHAFLDYNVRYFLVWRELNAVSETSVYYPARHLNDPAFAIVDARIKQDLASLTVPGTDSEQYVGTLAKNYILSDPIRYAYFHLSHLPVYLLASGIGAYKQVVVQIGAGSGGGMSTMYATLSALKELGHPDRLIAALANAAPIVLEVLFWAAVVVLAAVGILMERRRLEVWLFAALIGYFGVIVGAFTVARYRIPAEPFLFLLAAMGAYAIGSRAVAAYRAGKAAGEKVPGWARLTELVRYFVSGVTALLSSVIIYSVLVYGFGVEYILASFAGFVVAFFISFVLQKFFAFRDQAGPGRGGQILQYALLLLFNMGANTVLLVFFVGYIGMGRFLGLFLANALTAVWNFFVYDLFIFTERELHEPSLPKQLVGNLTDLSIVIPCHNEEGAIGAVLDSIPHGVGEIIVVDNNCTDRTAEIARSRGVIVLAETVPGTGAAMRAGFRHATKPIVAVIDGDNQHPAGELPRILHQLESEQLDFISAARFPLSDNWLRAFGNWGLTLVVNMLFGLPLTDSQSGMVMFRAKLLPGIDPKSDSFVFVQELKIRAAIAPRARFAESRIPCIPREHGQSKLLPIRHGVRILWSLVVLRATLGRER